MMEKNILYDEVLKFEELIKELINDSDVLTLADQIVIRIFTSSQRNAAYGYDKCSVEFGERIESTVANFDWNDAEEITTNMKYHIFSDPSMKINSECHFYEICLLIVNNFDEKNAIIGYLYLSIDEKHKALLQKIMDQKKNFLLIKYLINYIRSKIENYEKLYYLIDFSSEVISNKDHYMPYHMTNVANWAMLIANEMNIDYNERLVLYVSALIHDIGKVYVPESVINNPGKLSEAEYNLMKIHPLKGSEIATSLLQGMHYFSEVPNIIKYHHEWYDGEGYPTGAKGNEIPILSRIISVADAVDAMMSRRAYKGILTEDVIIQEIAKFSGRQFDPKISNVMIELLSNRSKNSDDTIIANTNFIPQASLSFFYKDIHTQISITGNLILSDGIGKLILHESTGFDEFESNKIFKCTISFYAMNDFVEYEVDLVGSLGNQVLLNHFKYVPTDKYFALIWNIDALLLEHEKEIQKIQMIKFGGDTLIFEIADTSIGQLLQELNKVFVVQLEAKVGDIVKGFSLQGRIIRYFDYGSKYVFVFKYLNISSPDRDMILRLLFKKQIYDKQLYSNLKNKNTGKSS